MKKQVNKILCCLLLVFACVVSALINKDINSVFAVSNATKYTNVLYDLQTDEDFDASDYVVDNDDYSLQVIQIAESNDKDLFIYVYQPCSPNKYLNATSINISQESDENLHFINYALTLLNSNGVFYKYKVNNFRFENTETRYYNISSIFRRFIAGLDEDTGNDNTISEIAFDVGKKYIANTVDGVVSYYCTEIATVLITDKFLDSFRYWNGYFIFAYEKVDRHFVAFSTDYDIDKLYEVDLLFTTKDYSAYNINILPIDLLSWEVSRTYESPVEHYLTLHYTQKSDVGAHGIFGHSYEWNRIETVDDFLSENSSNMNETTISNVSNKQFVLSFYETYWAESVTMGVSSVAGTEVYDLSILRLKFEVDGVVYNLGAIDNKQSSDNIPSNKNQHIFGLTTNGLKAILGIILFIIILILLAPFMPQIVNFVVWLFTGIWHIISAPFKAIKKNKNKKGGGKKWD